jgi:hypothetical protein
MKKRKQRTASNYRSLTGEERLQILFALVKQCSEWNPRAAKGFERIYRVVERDER